MAESMSLMEFVQKLFTDSDLRALFTSDPQAVMSDHGLSDLSPDDVCDALILAQDNQTADFSRDHNTGGNHIQLPPAPPVARPEPGESEHEAADQRENHDAPGREHHAVVPADHSGHAENPQGTPHGGPDAASHDRVRASSP